MGDIAPNPVRLRRRLLQYHLRPVLHLLLVRPLRQQLLQDLLLRLGHVQRRAYVRRRHRRRVKRHQKKLTREFDLAAKS